MENIANDKFIDDFNDAYDIAMGEDYEWQDALAYHVLEPMEYYLYCKEGAWDYLGDNNVPYDALLEKAMESGCLDMRELAFEVYGLEIEE